jgi:hypothetical protein
MNDSEALTLLSKTGREGSVEEEEEEEKEQNTEEAKSQERRNCGFSFFLPAPVILLIKSTVDCPRHLLSSI